jgi:hypothetical protein
MKINGKHELLAQFARRGLLLAVLLAMVLICANPGRGQSNVTTASAQDAKPAAATAVSAQTPAAIAKPAAAQAKAPMSPEEKPAAKGAKEGIVVHGHWTIEVKNPDGTRASLREFENALVQPSGADFLAALMLGTVVPGGYRVDLVGASTGPGSTGPCNLFTFPGSTVSTSTCFLAGSLISPAPSSFNDQATGCPLSAENCSPLSITSTVTGASFGGSVSGAQTAGGQITDVFLTPLTCPTGFLYKATNPVVASSPSTCAQGSAEPVGNLTHATLTSPVQVIAGQAISVTVVISFQ